ncbi:MAG TPA: 3-dehydroquinate synthase [Gemmatimonadaceae bacterium]|nr:3-dehydroquinate synthase [Gemmatimonadaceae bacterium]
MNGPLVLHGATIDVAPGALSSLGPTVHALRPDHRVVIIADEQVAALYGEAARESFETEPVLLTFTAGERNKTRATWASLTDRLISHGFGRDTIVVALGGGVTGDLAGFVAATYLRGVPFVQVPTTLLAMIDASIGGKTGVDTQAGKNLVGAFHQPAHVLIDPRLLTTLPPAVMREGLAEAIKHGVIADGAYFGWIAASLREILDVDALDEETAQHLVRRSVEIKVGVVRQDERELGMRKILNFGHTIAHAVEHVTAYGVSHGEAVAIGMVAEAILAERLRLAERGLSDAIATVCDAAGLPVRLPEGASPAEIVGATRTDKKARGGHVEYALPRALGEMAGSESGYAVRPTDADVLRALERL